MDDICFKEDNCIYKLVEHIVFTFYLTYLTISALKLDNVFDLKILLFMTIFQTLSSVVIAINERVSKIVVYLGVIFSVLA